MITATRQIIRQDMGDWPSPMPLCRRYQLLHNSICYASSYYNSLPVFFQYLVVHPDRKQTIFRAEFPHGFVVVLDGRQPACVLRLAMRKFHSDLWSAF